MFFFALKITLKTIHRKRLIGMTFYSLFSFSSKTVISSCVNTK